MCRGLRTCLTALAFALFLIPAPLLAQGQDLSRTQALQLARGFLAEGQPEMTRAIAEAILQADARDSDAQVLMAAALQAMGASDASSRHARAAHRHGATAQTRFEGAMLAGRAAFDREAYGQAQFWLRRAAQTAPDDAARAQAARNFAAVRRVNPLDLQFNLGVRQASNINNGSSAEVIELLGLPFRVLGSSRALSGQELRMDVSLRYRIAESSRSRTALSFSLATRSYRLSREARAQAPDARAGDFAYQRAELGLIHQMARPGHAGQRSLATAFGRSWYGGRPLSDHIRLSLSQSAVISPQSLFRVSLTAQRTLRHDNSARSSTRIGLGGALYHSLPRGDQVELHLGAEHTAARSIHVQNTMLRAALGYRLATPVAGTRLSADIDLEQRRFPAGAQQPLGRRDRTATLGLRAEFERIDYMGFMPVLEMQFSRTRSNIPIHARRSTDISLGIQSRF